MVFYHVWKWEGVLKIYPSYRQPLCYPSFHVVAFRAKGGEGIPSYRTRYFKVVQEIGRTKGVFRLVIEDYVDPQASSLLVKYVC